MLEDSPMMQDLNLTELTRDWESKHPLRAAGQLTRGLQNEVLQGMLQLMPDPHVQCCIAIRKPGTIAVKTKQGTPESSLLTSLPLYSARHANPGWTRSPYTIYFELKIRSIDEAASLAIGFGAEPFPHFSLPGRARASIGVHSSSIRSSNEEPVITIPFEAGQVIGVGLTLRPSPASLLQDWASNHASWFVTQHGKRIGEWAIDDASGSGLRGERDLCAVLGFSGAVDVEFRARKDEWAYHPEPNWDTQGGWDMPWMPRIEGQ